MARRIVNVSEAKMHFSKLRDVERGEEILIGRSGEPVARLSPIQRGARELNFADAQIWIADDFDETPDEIVEDFYR